MRKYVRALNKIKILYQLSLILHVKVCIIMHVVTIIDMIILCQKLRNTIPHLFIYLFIYKGRIIFTSSNQQIVLKNSSNLFSKLYK